MVHHVMIFGNSLYYLSSVAHAIQSVDRCEFLAVGRLILCFVAWAVENLAWAEET